MIITIHGKNNSINHKPEPAEPGSVRTGAVLTHAQAAGIFKNQLWPELRRRFALEGFMPRLLTDGTGPNLVYACEKSGAGAKILRLSYQTLRTRGDLLAETEYVRYLRANSGSVAGVLPSRDGSLVETVDLDGRLFHACLFERARGERLADRGYRYREGVPLTAYYFDCGKTLGRLHRLSKGYKPAHRRYDFFEWYTEDFIRKAVPASLSLLKEKMTALLRRLETLPRDAESYGMVHFDFGDGNYHIDFETGQLTVYDFDNCCTCWYLYDLADVWMNGTGWTGFEADPGKRRALMQAYFNTVLEGYRTEMDISEEMLSRLPLFIQALSLEAVMDYFVGLFLRGETVSECEEEVSYLIRCLEEDIPYRGFFHDIYDPEEPFECEPRKL